MIGSGSLLLSVRCISLTALQSYLASSHHCLLGSLSSIRYLCLRSLAFDERAASVRSCGVHIRMDLLRLTIGGRGCFRNAHLNPQSHVSNYSTQRSAQHHHPIRILRSNLLVEYYLQDQVPYLHDFPRAQP